MEGGQECVGVWGQVDSSGGGLEVQNGADERRVLVREPIVLLSRPGARLDIVDATDTLVPFCFSCLVYCQPAGLPDGMFTVLTIFTNLAYCTIIVCTIPKKLSYDGKIPVRPVRVYPCMKP